MIFDSITWNLPSLT